jgi:NAD-dependent dihydropyrimidine dehydrogenase PreA subunit
MIEITVDERACVSCTLCEAICPTDVFIWDENTGVPKVDKPGECFGCLSCSEICPPHCISHDGVELSESHYHDPYALRLATRLATDVSKRWNVPSDDRSRQNAAADLGVRLRSVAEVFKRTLGGSLPAVGTMAGRTLARHLPRYREPNGLDEALVLARAQFAPAWEFETSRSGDELEIRVERCFVRETCEREGVELGGEMCILFYNYLAGYLGQMGKVRLRLMDADRGPSCCYRVKIYEK